MTIWKGWNLRHLDFNNAFLNGKLTEDVYMYQPFRYIDPSFSDYLWKLNKAIHRLKQASRACNTTLTIELLQLGFINSRLDSSLFIFHNTSSIILFMVYVDDVIISGNNFTMIDTLIKSLDTKFALKYLGQLHYFLKNQVQILTLDLSSINQICWWFPV